MYWHNYGARELMYQARDWAWKCESKWNLYTSPTGEVDDLNLGKKFLIYGGRLCLISLFHEVIKVYLVNECQTLPFERGTPESMGLEGHSWTPLFKSRSTWASNSKAITPLEKKKCIPKRKKNLLPSHKFTWTDIFHTNIVYENMGNSFFFFFKKNSTGRKNISKG